MLEPDGGEVEEVVRLSVPRATPHLRLVRKVVALTAQQLDFPPEDVDKIELAVDEACSNAMLHAEPQRPEAAGTAQIHLEVRVGQGRLTVVLKDGGEAFAFDAKGRFELADQLASSDRGGLGIYMMRQLMDEVSHFHSPVDGNVVTLVKLLPATTGAARG